MHRALALIGAAVLAVSPLSADTGEDRIEIDGERIDLVNERRAIHYFQARDQRLQDIGWRLVRGNALFCDRVIPAIGLQLQDLASYGAPQIARAALGMSGDFAVQTAARGSPADLAGDFAANREIALIGEVDPNAWEAGAKLDWQRLARAHDHVDAALARSGAIAIAFADGASAQIEPVEVCATRFELMGEGKRAVADGKRVVIGIEFPAFAYEDAEFAALIAHELAHNLLGHTAWLDRNGRSRRNVRRTEREADRLIPWLLANAGYDPAAGQRFMEAWGPGNDGGLLRNRSHDGWDERAEFIAGEIPRIEALVTARGKADWSVHFEREIDPAQGLADGAER